MNADAALAPMLRDLGGDRATLAELVTLLIEEAPRLLAEGRAATQRKDVGTAQRAYHTLKGNAAQFGAQDVHDLAMAIEQAAKAGTLPNDAALTRIEAAWTPWQASYRSWLAQVKATA